MVIFATIYSSVLTKSFRLFRLNFLVIKPRKTQNQLRFETLKLTASIPSVSHTETGTDSLCTDRLRVLA